MNIFCKSNSVSTLYYFLQVTLKKTHYQVKIVIARFDVPCFVPSSWWTAEVGSAIVPDLYLKDSLGLTDRCCSPTTVVLWPQLLPSSCSLPPHSSCPSSLPQIKELQLVLAEAHDSLRGLQEQLSQERQLRKEEADNFNQKMVQVRGAQCPTYTYSNLPSLTGRQKSQRPTSLKKAGMSGETWVFLLHGCGVSAHVITH